MGDDKEMSYKIAIIGLGLMGASLACALRGFRNAQISGTDKDLNVIKKALDTGIVDEASADITIAVHNADLVIFCVYAHNIPALVKACAPSLKKDAVVSDICGVKGSLYAELGWLIPDSVNYVGVHPMAGKERDGIDNADKAIYKNSGFIICPLPSTTETSIALMKEMAAYIGAKNIQVAPIGLHDEIIAYTSGLMHIASAALCIDYHPQMTAAFTAGAYRDCTRIADINAGAWTELLLDNREHTLAYLSKYIRNLQDIQTALSDRNEQGLYDLLDTAGQNKREMLLR